MASFSHDKCSDCGQYMGRALAIRYKSILDEIESFVFEEVEKGKEERDVRSDFERELERVKLGKYKFEMPENPTCSSCGNYLQDKRPLVVRYKGILDEIDTYVKVQAEEGKNPKMVRAGFKQWVTRLQRHSEVY